MNDGLSEPTLCSLASVCLVKHTYVTGCLEILEPGTFVVIVCNTVVVALLGSGNSVVTILRT